VTQTALRKEQECPSIQLRFRTESDPCEEISPPAKPPEQKLETKHTRFKTDNIN
jgi:hypothetical protein